LGNRLSSCDWANAERVPIFVGFEVAVPHLMPAWW